MKIYEAVKMEIEQEAKSTRRMLERVPDDKLDWRPHEKSMTLGSLASHLAEIPSWLEPTVTQDELDIPEGFKAWAASNTKELVAKFDENMKLALKSLEKADESAIMNMWALKFGGKQMMQLPRLVVLRNFVTNHLVHHRAQLGVYLRLLGVPVPSVYGPSADEQVQ